MKILCPECGVYSDPGESKCIACGAELPIIKKNPEKSKLVMKPVQNKNLFDCKDCGGKVSKNAKVCPHCGLTFTTVPQKITQFGCGLMSLGVIIPIIFIAFLMIFDSGTKDKKPDQIKKPQLTEAQKAQKKAAYKKEKNEKDELCKKDLQCWGDKHLINASVYSQDQIERMAKHDFKWKKGWGAKLTKWRWKDKSKLTLTYFGDKIKFQNGFGAWTNMIYIVDYDPINERLLNVSIREGRLPK